MNMANKPKANLKAHPASSSATRSLDERDKRLMLAEEILSDLATGYWVARLDDNDDPVKEQMGQRILNYWRKWNSPENAGADAPAIKDL